MLNADYRAGSVPSQTAIEILKNVEALNPRFKVNLTAKQWSTVIQDSRNGKQAMIPNGWLDEGRRTTDPHEKPYAQVGRAAYDGAYHINLPAAARIFAHRDNLQGVAAAAYSPMRAFILGV